MSPKRTPRRLRRPELSERQILAWADDYRRLTGQWPAARCQPRLVPAAPAENWFAIDSALRVGFRGLPGGSSLAKLLAARRGVRNAMDLPPLDVTQVLQWCDEFWERTGEWPRVADHASDTIPGSHGETWAAVNGALRQARRGLPGPMSLADLLAHHRGVRNVGDLPPLTVHQVLDWADGYHALTGRWPTENAEPQEIPRSGGDTWRLLIVAMRKGNRGFPPNTSLAELLAQHRDVRNIQALPHLNTAQILEWADEFFAVTGEWPTRGGSPQEIPGTGGELWCNVDQAMRKGLRGLSPGTSLAALLSERRGVRNSNLLPPLTLSQVLRWADAFFEKTGKWPTVRQFPQSIDGTDGERWRNLDNALRYGLRGFPGGSSLAKLLAQHRGVPNTKAPMNRRMASR